MEEIKRWLNEASPDFDQGFALFCKYSRNQSLMSYIGRKRQMEMLTYELGKLATIGKITPNPHHKAQSIMFGKKAVEEVIQERVQVIDERRIMREDLPEALRELYDQNVEDYKLLRSLHEKLKNANSDAGRKEFREKILKLQGEIKRRWSIIDRGEVPVEDDSVSSARINSNRAYISKMLKVENLTEKQREMIREKYAELISAKVALKPETLQKLKERGF